MDGLGSALLFRGIGILREALMRQICNRKGECLSYKKKLLSLGLFVCYGPLSSHAQNIHNESLKAEARIQTEDSIAFTLPGFKPGQNADAGSMLMFHDLSFEGAPVPMSNVKLKQLDEGVYELIAEGPKVGIWSFAVNDAAEGYFALGERFDSLNHSHEIIKNSSQDNASAKGTGTYKPIPFFMSTSGYGLWIDTTAEATFDLNVTSRTNVLMNVPAQKLRVVLIAGPEFPHILEHFTLMAGRSIVPPYWTFAPWVGRDYHRNKADVDEDISKTRSLGLPGDVLLIDSPWASGYNSYIFNPKQFDDADAMIKRIHQASFKLVLWHTSWINNKTKAPGETGFSNKIDVQSSNYIEAAEHGYFVKDASGNPYHAVWWKGEGSLIDFTNPEAKVWWQQQVGKAVDAGADGFKDDDAEGAFLGDAKFADGTDVRIMRNRYAVLYNNAVEEVLQKKLNGNGILFMRSATVGNHNLAFLWGGDNEASFSTENGLPTVVTAGLGAGLSGMPLWTADLGGYLKTSTTPDSRLFMRWTEYSSFSPVMEMISTSNLNAWDYGEEALQNYRKYAVLHMTLFPYIYAAAQQASRSGMPIMRALVLQYQNDQRAREAKDEYLFGPDFLVAPVIDENTSRVVYLPDGNWVNYWTGKPLHGSKLVVTPAALDVLPLFVRAGAVIPKIPEEIMSLVPKEESGNASVKSLDNRRVYEVMPDSDPNVSIASEDFEGRKIVRTRDSLSVDGMPARLIIRWRFDQVTNVRVNGSPYRVQTDASESYIEVDHSRHSKISWKDR